MVIESMQEDTLDALRLLVIALRCLGNTHLLTPANSPRSKIKNFWLVFVLMLLSVDCLIGIYFGVEKVILARGTYGITRVISIFSGVVYFTGVIVAMVMLYYKGNKLWNVFEDAAGHKDIGQGSRNPDVRFFMETRYSTSKATPMGEGANVSSFSVLSRKFISFITVSLICLALSYPMIDFYDSLKHDRQFEKYQSVSLIVVLIFKFLLLFEVLAQIVLVNFLYIVLCKFVLLKIAFFNSLVESMTKSEKDPDFEALFASFLNVYRTVSTFDDCFNMIVLVNHLSGLIYVCTVTKLLFFPYVNDNFTVLIKMGNVVILMVLVIEMFLMLLSASSVHTESRASLGNLYKLAARIPTAKADFHFQLNSLISKVSSSIGLTVGGMFTISRKTIASAVMTVLTYMVLLYQLDLTLVQCPTASTVATETRFGGS